MALVCVLVFFAFGLLRPLETRVLVVEPPVSEQEEMPKIVFVIDDWGYSLAPVSVLFEIKSPITLAVLPNLRFTRHIARNAFQRNFEIILHQPMEAKGAAAREKETIMVGMPQDMVSEVFERAISSVPEAVGVSNHQGSKATGDPEVMQVLLSDISTKELFFLDSVTTGSSVAGDVAEKLSVPCLKRDVFLDNKNTPEAISLKIDELAAIAKSEGRAIGIGHARTLTLEVIRDSIPRLEKEGLKVATLKDLLEP